MTIQTTNWAPDTCGCQLKYEWDDAVPENQRVTSLSVVNKSCPYHSALLPNQLIVYNTIMDENQKKNNSLQVAVDTIPQSLADTVINPDGSTTNYLKSSVAYNWSFSGTAPNRTISITFTQLTTLNKRNPTRKAAASSPLLTQQQKDQIQQTLDGIYGTGIILVQ